MGQNGTLSDSISVRPNTFWDVSADGEESYALESPVEQVWVTAAHVGSYEITGLPGGCGMVMGTVPVWLKIEVQ